MSEPHDTDPEERRTPTGTLSPLTRRRALALGGATLTGATLTGHGAAQEGTPTQAGTLDKQVGMVAAAGRFFYTVPFRWVEPGTTVVWQLVQGSHSTTAYAEANGKPHRIPSEAPGWDSGVLSEPGATFERTFNVPGVYDYYCAPHEGLGMVGRLVVGFPDVGNQPALAEPGDSLPPASRAVLSGLNAATRVLFAGQG